jgi:hypothetical protein
MTNHPMTPDGLKKAQIGDTITIEHEGETIEQEVIAEGWEGIVRYVVLFAPNSKNGAKVSLATDGTLSFIQAEREIE